MDGWTRGLNMDKGAGAISTDNSIETNLLGAPRHISEMRRIFNVILHRKTAFLGLLVIFLTIIVAIFAPLFAPYDPYKPDVDNALQNPSWNHVLGTDPLGRDTLSRIIYGTRTSLTVGVVAILLASFMGMALGLVAGYFGGVINAIIMRFIDSLMSFPMILLALFIAVLLGGGLTNVIIALGIGLTSIYARLMCGQVLSVKENEYITAERALGASNLRIMLQHILPNCLPPLIVLITLNLGAAILAEAGLSYLGIGINPPGASWGAMVSEGYRYLLRLPILSFAPGIAIMLVVFAFNMLGDGLRDALDPRLRGLL
jgi:peptide/nickel transport system permease protein